jgi:hypothetical protein
VKNDSTHQLLKYAATMLLRLQQVVRFVGYHWSPQQSTFGVGSEMMTMV